MKRLLISVAVLLFATMLFVNEEESESNDQLAKEEVVLNSSESEMGS